MTSKPVIELFPEDMTAIEGNRVVLPVRVIGSPQPTFTWLHDNTHLESDYAYEIASDGSLTIMTAEMRHTGVYRLVARSSKGSAMKQFSLNIISEDEDPPAVTAAVVIQSKPVPVAEFGQYVAQNHANTNTGFSTLYNVRDIIIASVVY